MKKRKRRSSKGSLPAEGSSSKHRPSHLPAESINPLSHSPNTLRQFAVAGLAGDELEPSKSIPNFPHRAIPDEDRRSSRRNTADIPDSTSESGVTGTEDESQQQQVQRKKKAKSARVRHEGIHAAALTEAICRLLNEGEIAKAKTAFGLLQNVTVHGWPFDIRYNHYWALGAEILMREGEERYRQQKTSLSEEISIASLAVYPNTRWGATQNLPNVKAYFDALIKQYPYNHKYKNAVSAVDFWPALLSCEIYNVYIEQVVALKRLDDESVEWDDSMTESVELYMADSDMVGSEIHGAEGLTLSSRDLRARTERDQIRQLALTQMRDIASRMDDLLQSLPYSRSYELLRLRGTASLYISDLLIPAIGGTPEDKEDAFARRAAEREIARRMFQKLVDSGGELDHEMQRFLEVPTAEVPEESVAKVLYTTLPIRRAGGD
jgi:hypothetical protein